MTQYIRMLMSCGSTLKAGDTIETEIFGEGRDQYFDNSQILRRGRVYQYTVSGKWWSFIPPLELLALEAE